MAGFELQTHLMALAAHPDRTLAFTARTLAEYADWQAALRQALRQRLGLAERAAPPVAAERLEVVERATYVEEKYALAVGEGVRLPLYVLVPRRPPPFKTVLVFHGHEPSAQFCLGQYPDAETEQANLAIDNNYAQALAQAGYLVALVEQRGFGERVTADTRGGPFPRSCQHLALTYLLYGRTVLGERCWDGQRAVDYLLTRPDVLAAGHQLGCTGHSGGAATALWLAALDVRLQVVVVSGYFSSFRAALAPKAHCACNYVPGLLNLAEMGDLAALLAPRPFCALNGAQDPLFPVEAAQVQFETVRRAYALHQAEAACALRIHPGGHAYQHALSQAWLADWLK